MKRMYIRPFTEIIRLDLSDEILDDIPIGGASRGARSEDAWAKRHTSFYDDDDASFDPVATHNARNLWED